MQAVLRPVPSAELRVYAVWVPVMGEDGEATARRAAERFTDPRLRHYWDPSGEIGRAFGRALRLPGARALGEKSGFAYDVYLVYPATTRWLDTPPRPE